MSTWELFYWYVFEQKLWCNRNLKSCKKNGFYKKIYCLSLNVFLVKLSMNLWNFGILQIGNACPSLKYGYLCMTTFKSGMRKTSLSIVHIQIQVESMQKKKWNLSITHLFFWRRNFGAWKIIKTHKDASRRHHRS